MWPPECSRILSRPPKRHILGRKHAFWRRPIDRADRSRNATWARDEESKKRNKKGTRKFDKSHICPDHPGCATPTKVVMRGGFSDVVINAKFPQNRFRGFGSLWGRNLPFFYDWRLCLWQLWCIDWSIDRFILLSKQPTADVRSVLASREHTPADAFSTRWLQLKRYYSLFIYVHSKGEQNKNHLQLSNLQFCHFNIVILRVAIISNVQNVRLQSQHRPTDDAFTRRWRGSQQTGPAHRSSKHIYYVISNTFF